jgi:hypothetical protein
MGEKSIGVGEHLFAIEGIVDKSQHWHIELYPWTSSTNPIIKRWIGDTLLSTE